MPAFAFSQDQQYTRKELRELMHAPVVEGGAWFTGVASNQGAYFIFTNIGTAGRVGQNYGNYFIGDDLDWSGATRSNRRHAQVQAITASDAEVHLFYRKDSSSAFTYAGLASALTVSDTSPVRVLWRFSASQTADPLNETANTRTEGARKTAYVQTYERSPQARLDCIEYHGTCCKVCKVNLGHIYGDLGKGFIHVHHLLPISSQSEEHEVSPTLDLVPVCPNCHAMLHRVKPPLEVSELQALMKNASEAVVLQS